MNRVTEIKSLLLIPAFIVSYQVKSQTEGQVLPSDIRQQTIVTEPVTLKKGFLRSGFQVGYRVADRQFDNSGKKDYYTSVSSGSSSSLNMTLQYGFNDRFELSLLAEYQTRKIENTASTVSTETETGTTETNILKGIGFGDTHISARYQFFREERNIISVTGSITSVIPTGEKNPTNIRNAKQYDLPVGDGSYALTTGLLVRTILYPYSFTAYLNFTKNFSGSKKFGTDDQDIFEFRFGNRLETGITTNIHLNDWIVFTNDLGYYHEAPGEVTGSDRYTLPASWAFTYKPNLYFQVKRFRIAESVAVPVWGKNVPADPLFLMVVQYVF